MEDAENEIPSKANEFKTGCLYRTRKPFSSRDFDMDSHPRWLLYLGKNKAFDGYSLGYCFSPTTQLKHFMAGGDKENSPYLSYSKGQYGFTSDCIIPLVNPQFCWGTGQSFDSYASRKKA